MSKLGKSYAVVLCVLICAGAAGTVQGADVPLEIQWLSGPVAAAAQDAKQIRENLATLAARPTDRHLVVQFDKPLDPAQRAELEDAGLRLLSYLGGNAFFASTSKQGVDVEVVSRVESLVEVKAIARDWRLHPYLLEGNVPPWAVVSPPESEGKEGPTEVGAYVLFHPDVPLVPDGVNTAYRHGARIRSHLESINGLVIELPYDNIASLADEDAVQWVEPPLPKFSELNNSNRARTGADIVQAPPYGLTGAGVNVLVYDGGYARASHVDFQGRLTVRDSSGMSDHATHVSGTVGGAGIGNPLYKGMAPGVTIQSYGFEQEGGLQEGFLYSDPGDLEDDYNEAINTHGADISNNSIGTNTAPNGFPCDWEGNYGITSALIDSIVRGSLGEPFRVVWANGNERQSTRCLGIEGFEIPYHSTAPPACAKNHITVGAMNSNDDSVTSFTSFGPADDGRMKPDVSAPGCQSDDDYDVTSCSSSGDSSYTGKCGTSMASPTVCGLSALLMEDFRVQYPGEPDFRNSTLKTMLAHTAVDLFNTGPDYQTGYGSVRIQPAVDLMRSGNFLEAAVAQGQVYSVLVVVNPGEDLKVTIAWDDVPGTPNVNPALVNDLDLVVYAPSGGQHFPWTLDPNNPSVPAVQTQANHVDNLEQVFVDSAESGAWQVEVHGYSVPVGSQPFSLTATPMLVNCSSQGIISLDRVKYACAGKATIQVVDCDLNTDDELIETIVVPVVSDSEPAGETVTLTETAAETALFRGTIDLSDTDAAGVLLVADADEIATTYIDEDNGSGGVNVVVEATAVVDCQAPIIMNVQTVDIEPHDATVTFVTNEPAKATVHYGGMCSQLNQSAAGVGFQTSHSITLTGLNDDTSYYYALDVEDEAGNGVYDDAWGNCYSFTTPDIPDFFTENFDDSDDNDLDNVTLMFIPDGTFDYYRGCAEPITELPTDPAGGTPVSWISTNHDDNYAVIDLAGDDTVSLYGVTYSTFYPGTNGYITFGAGDTDYSETLNDHFDTPRISALFDDLNANYGEVTWQQLADRAVVTWLNVPEYSNTGSNTFQIEMYFDGTIVMSYLAVSAADGIAGLSEGEGLSPDYEDTDLSAMGECGPPDCNGNGIPDDQDIAEGTSQDCNANEIPDECDVGPGGESPDKDGNGVPDECEALVPEVVAVGGRYIAVTPQPTDSTLPVALPFSGDPHEPDVACVSGYIQPDGTLEGTPVYQGASTWGTVYVQGLDVIPHATYAARADYGTPGSPLLTPMKLATTFRWGDTDGNGIVNLTDIMAAISGYQGDFSRATLQNVDIEPCVPDGIVNVTDILGMIGGFQGETYEDGTCPIPCR